jgi:hypothetical protein
VDRPHLAALRQSLDELVDGARSVAA